MNDPGQSRVGVFIEAGRKQVFACAVDWPGWCRSGRTEDLALAALAEYLPRYASVAARAGLILAPDAGSSLTVIERRAGTAGYTDFGVPGEIADSDHRALTGAEGRKLTAILDAAWDLLAQVAATAPAQLRREPEGGSRDRDQIVEHVISAEAMFARKLGVHPGKPSPGDPASVAAMRTAIAAVLSRPSDGSPVEPQGWPPRYGVRRIAWHVLDHAWEIGDKSAPQA